MRPRFDVDLSSCLQNHKNLGVSEVASRSRHLLLFTGGGYYTDDYFLELVIAMRRITNPKLLEVIPLCFSTAKMEVYIQKTWNILNHLQNIAVFCMYYT